MVKKTIIIVLLTGLLAVFGQLKGVYAADDDLQSYISDTIENDRKDLSNLSPILEKMYNAAITAFKKFGTLSKEIGNVVDMFNKLDETDQEYENRLAEFFEKYNELSPIKRKVVNAITGVLDMKDAPLDSIRHSIVVDMYSTKKLNVDFAGSCEYLVENETIAKVSNGTINPVSVGYTSMKCTDQSGEETIYRIVVKKPVLSSTVGVKKKQTVVIKLPEDGAIENIQISNDKISYVLDKRELTVSGNNKGTAYIYVGTDSGRTLKYKIKVK